MTACTLATGPLEADTIWRRTTWRGEEALASDREGWTAIVGIARCRLVHFGPLGGPNLLFEGERVDPRGPGDHPAWGGHVFWLGPQAEWKPGWPPSDDWDHAAAVSVEVADGAVELLHPEADARYPRMRRTYRWVAGGLECRVAWDDAAGRFQGVHLVQVPDDSEVRVTRLAGSQLPAGFAVWKLGAAHDRGAAMPQPGVVTHDAAGFAFRRPVAAGAKYAFPATVLAARREGWELRVAPGGWTGETLDWPDAELVMQLWLPAAQAPQKFFELEYSSPRLRTGPASGPCSVAVVLSVAPAR